MEQLKVTSQICKTFVILVLLFLCHSTFAASTRPVSVLLQEGLYAEEVEGNLDEAIKIYQQVIKSSEQMEQAAAQASYRIGLCYVKKGDTDQAAKQFSQLISKYPKQESLIKEAQKQIEKLQPALLKPSPVPVVISTKPDNFSNNVSTNTKEISVTFDKEMMDKSWSWVKWNYTFPEITGQISYDKTKTICTLPVKLEPGKAYLVRINAGQYSSFMSSDRVKAQPFVFVFSTLDASGKPTPIPDEMIDFAKQINSAKPDKPYTQELHADIMPDGLFKFKNIITQKNTSGSNMTTNSFVNSDNVNITSMQDDKNRPLKFTTTHNGNIFRYYVTLNEPVMAGDTFTYSTEGTMAGMIKSVIGNEDTYMFRMSHSPAVDRPTLRIETYLLPKGAELVSMNPANMKRAEKDGRIELRHEELIPVGGNIVTQFQYKLEK